MVAGLQGGERRGRERHRCQFATTYNAGAAHPDGVRWWCRVHDYSRTGLCLVVARSLRPGTPIAVELPGPYAENCCTLRGRVIRVAREGTKSFAIGCMFGQMLSAAEFQVLQAAAGSE